jgi:ATP-binding cassette subfamily B protein
VEVELNDVHFSYDDETEALSGVTLDIRPGEKLAIVGENGSGKTTLAKLILSLYKPTSGTLTLSNASGVLSDARTSAVMQEYVRYLLSIRENIGFGDPEKLTDDAALAAAYESVTGEPLFDALDAQLGAKYGGRELSGGQWQRLALARAYLKEAPLIVLDEPNASIDAFAEAAMIKRMFEMAKDKTCIFITHRLTTTALADRIIVMKDGRICEEGTHEELMRRNGEYARMYSVQAEMYA